MARPFCCLRIAGRHAAVELSPHLRLVLDDYRAAAACAQLPWSGFTESTLNLYVAISASSFIAPGDPNQALSAVTVRRSDLTDVVTFPASVFNVTLPLSTSARSA